MEKRLSETVINQILNDADLYAATAKIMNILPGSLKQTLMRNGNTVNRIDRVEAIAKLLNLPVQEILEEKQIATA